MNIFAIIVIIALVLVVWYFATNSTWVTGAEHMSPHPPHGHAPDTGLGCRYNPYCSCGEDCQCGPGCRCGIPDPESAPVEPEGYGDDNGEPLPLAPVDGELYPYDYPRETVPYSETNLYEDSFPCIEAFPGDGDGADADADADVRVSQSDPEPGPGCVPLTDTTCKNCEKVFRTFSEDASILPGIGLPSQNSGVCTITHGMGPGAKKLRINGLESSSPLANNALFSTECAQGKNLNLYEVMVPEGISSEAGASSAAQLYAKDLNDMGLSVAGTHWHWWGADPYVDAIHHQNAGMEPTEFTRRTVQALSNYKGRTGM